MNDIPGGTCNFDLPQYHYWLNQPFEVREDQMGDWMQELNAVREAVILLLNLVRNSTVPSKQLAAKGFFQKSLESPAPAQLVRVGLPHGTPLFVEISGNKHRFSIRFLEAMDVGRPSQTNQDVEFQLTNCVF